MFEVECAYRLAAGALTFLHDSDVPDGHDDFCVLRVAFIVTDIYPPERDTGADWDWRGDVGVIELRATGGYSDQFNRWRTLRGTDYDTAQTFLLKVHGRELWQAGDAIAEAMFYREAAA